MKTKKVLSVLLSIVMILTMAVPAFASSDYDRDKVAANDTETIDSLSAEQIAGVILDWVDRKIAIASSDFAQFDEQLALVGMTAPQNLDGVIAYKDYVAQLGGDFANLDTSALSTRAAGTDIDFINSVLAFMAANSDTFGKVFAWEEGQTFDFGLVGEFITNPENNVDEAIVNFYNDYLIGNNIQEKFVKEIAREMNYEIKDGETFDEVIDNGIKAVVVGFLQDAGFLSDEAAAKVYDDAQFDLKTEDVYALVKKLITLVQEDNWADLTMYYTYLLDNVARPLLKTAFGYTATVTAENANVAEEFKAAYQDLAALEEISGGKVQYQANDGSYAEVTISNGEIASAKKVVYGESFINFEAPEVTIADKGEFSATYTPTSPDTASYNPTVYTSADYAQYIDEDMLATSAEFGVNVSTEELPEKIANLIAAGNGVAMKDAFVMTVGASIDQSLEITFEEIEQMANETIAAQLPSIQTNMVDPAVAQAVAAANSIKQNMGQFGSFLPEFTGSVTINSVTVKLDYTGYSDDDTFVCQVTVTPTYDITYGGNVWDYAQYAGITKDKIQSDYIAPAVENAIQNPVATIAVENLSGSIEGFDDVTKLMGYVDTDFDVDTSVLDFAANYDAYNGAIGQMNRVLVDTVAMVLTDDGEAWLGLKEGGNENLTANLQTICDKANSLVATVEDVLNNNQYSDFIADMGIDVDSIMGSLGADFLYDIDFSSVEGLYVTAIKTAAEIAPEFIDDATVLEVINLVKGYDTLEQMAVAVFNYAMPKCADAVNEALAKYDVDVKVAFEATTDASAIENDAAAKEYIMDKGVALLYDAAAQAVPAANKIINDAIAEVCDYLGVKDAPVVNFVLGAEQGNTWEETLANLVDRFYELTDGILLVLDKDADVYGKISAVANGFLPLASMLSNAGKNGANGALDVAYVMDVLFGECLAGDFGGFLKMFEVKEDAIAGDVPVTKALINASEHMVDAVFPDTVKSELYAPAIDVQENFTSSANDVVIASNNMKSIDAQKAALVPAVLNLVREAGLLPYFASCDHTTTTDVAEVPATCVAKGTTAGKVCVECGKVVEGCEEIAINPANHAGPIENVEAVKATCTTDGASAGSKCTACGVYVTEVTTAPALGHTYGDFVETKAATCTADGERAKTCSRCGDVVKETIKATGHSFGEWVTTKNATCKESGVQTRTCACGATETKSIAKLPHNYAPAVVVKNPTCTETGVKTSTCTTCGDVKSEVIAAKGHTDADKDNKCDECGETISTSFGARIKAFFQKILNWFKNLF